MASQLYSVARAFTIWTSPAGYLGYPNGWAPIQITYDPAHVTPGADSWQLLLDPKYKKRVVVEDQPVEVMAYMGKAAGVKDPYNMTDAEIAQAKALLVQLKPNILRLAPQATDTVAALKNGEAWIATINLGADTRGHGPGRPEADDVHPQGGLHRLDGRRDARPRRRQRTTCSCRSSRSTSRPSTSPPTS